ncbi:MAG: HmuY family protein [Bacteroides sp.]|nr:HmuY family protein [Bacteroides sp.]
MKRSRNTIFKYTIVLGAAMSLSACNGIFEDIYDAPIETEMEIKGNSFSQVKTVEYTEWAYIELSNRKVTTVPIGEEYESQIPEDWDFAIHRYDIKTNEGAACQTSYTSIDDLKTSGKLPDEKDFVEDEWTTDKIAIDMSGMMDGNIVYTESYRNAVLSGWLDVNTSTMPPVYTMSNQVFLIRMKDNTYAAIRFTNYMNARGIKGYIDFDFSYPLDFDDNNETNN